MATPLVDIYGQTVQVKPGTREAALGRGQLYGICVRTRRGVKGFEATWYPSGNTATFAGKRGATAFVKAHEQAFYALPRIGADAPAQNDGWGPAGYPAPQPSATWDGTNGGMPIVSHPAAIVERIESERAVGSNARCLWCAGSSDIVTDAESQLCRAHLAEFDGVSVAQLDAQDAAAVADLL